jgi:peptidyl-prolyl cis-trans isomerase A (cyclophilin A)
MRSIRGGSLFAALALATACAFTASAQTSSGSQPASSKPAASHAMSQKGGGMSNSQSLMNPAALNEKAPSQYQVKFVTTKGDFTLEVYRVWAPIGADRFYNLVKHGFYNNCTIFRVVPGFVTQFGISGDPKLAAVWEHANIKDDPVTQSNKLGTITFATAGPNTRTTQVFINYSNNTMLDNQGFAPFGKVVSGMSVVEGLYGGYKDQPTEHQGEISSQGNAYLEKNFPKLDVIKSATIVAK